MPRSRHQRDDNGGGGDREVTSEDASNRARTADARPLCRHASRTGGRRTADGGLHPLSTARSPQRNGSSCRSVIACRRPVTGPVDRLPGTSKRIHAAGRLARSRAPGLSREHRGDAAARRRSGARQRWRSVLTDDGDEHRPNRRHAAAHGRDYLMCHCRCSNDHHRVDRSSNISLPHLHRPQLVTDLLPQGRRFPDGVGSATYRPASAQAAGFQHGRVTEIDDAHFQGPSPDRERAWPSVSFSGRPRSSREASPLNPLRPHRHICRSPTRTGRICGTTTNGGAAARSCFGAMVEPTRLPPRGRSPRHQPGGSASRSA